MSLFTEFNHLEQIMQAMHKAAGQIVKKTALDCQARAMANAPVATGFMKSAIYTVTKDSSNYGQGAGSPPSGAELLSEVDLPPDDQTAFVAAGASYSEFVEFGTSKAPAQPFLTPAADAVRPAFEDAMEHLEDALKRAGF